MTLTLELNCNEESALEASARAHGVSAEQFVQQIPIASWIGRRIPQLAPPGSVFLNASPKSWPMSHLRNSPGSPETAPVRLTMTRTLRKIKDYLDTGLSGTIRTASACVSASGYRTRRVCAEANAVRGNAYQFVCLMAHPVANALRELIQIVQLLQQTKR